MTELDPPRPSVIVVGHDARATGGVNNYLRILRRKLRGNITITRFVSGRRFAETGFTQALVRIARDQLRFALNLRRFRYDVLHINPSLDFSSFLRDTTYIYINQIVSPSTAVLLFYRGWSWRAFARYRGSALGRRFFRSINRRADAILVLSDDFRDALIDTGVPSEKIRVTSTFFDGDALRAVPNVERHPRRAIFLSRFLPAKGGHVVIDAFAKVLERISDAELLMAGSGPEADAWALRAEARGIAHAVRFTGYLDSSRKMAALAGSTIFVLPTSHPEGMPNAVLEAMAAGTVIVSSFAGAIPHIVGEDGGGRLLRNPDADSVAEAIAFYFERPEEAAVAGARNAERAWSRWEAGIVAEDLASVYRKLAR